MDQAIPVRSVLSPSVIASIVVSVVIALGVAVYFIFFFNSGMGSTDQPTRETPKMTIVDTDIDSIRMTGDQTASELYWMVRKTDGSFSFGSTAKQMSATLTTTADEILDYDYRVYDGQAFAVLLERDNGGFYIYYDGTFSGSDRRRRTIVLEGDGGSVKTDHFATARGLHRHVRIVEHNTNYYLDMYEQDQLVDRVEILDRGTGGSRLLARIPVATMASDTSSSLRLLNIIAANDTHGNAIYHYEDNHFLLNNDQSKRFSRIIDGTLTLPNKVGFVRNSSTQYYMYFWKTDTSTLHITIGNYTSTDADADTSVQYPMSEDVLDIDAFGQTIVARTATSLAILYMDGTFGTVYHVEASNSWIHNGLLYYITNGTLVSVPY